MSRKNKKDELKFLSTIETVKRFEKFIEIHPIFLNEKILDLVKNKFFSTYENSCDEECIIVKIKEIISISNIISKDCSSVIFKIKFDAISVKPEIGYKLGFNPVKIISKGIFGKLYGNSLNIFIHSSENWEFIEEEECFYIKNVKKLKLTKFSNVIASIIAIKFDFNNSVPKYNCICNILTVE